MNMFTKIIAASALAASASAHMIMTNPVPFDKDTITLSPLAPEDFPCKHPNGAYGISTMNQWNAGETQVVSFKGTATHGGGSCQFSISTDTEPTKNSQWKVIQSVVGNCPTDAPGNLDGAFANKQPGTFPVTMPADIPDGQYTFAWTWINKVGNREFYMNCAPIKVGSGTSPSNAEAQKVLATLPDMFVVNLPSTECSTAENEDFQYPNPGQSVITGQSVKLGNTLSGSGCTSQNAMGAGAGSVGSPSAGTSTPSQGTTSTPSQGTPSTPSNVQGPNASNTPSNPGGVFAPGASPAPAAPSSIAQPAPPAKGATPPVANSPPAGLQPPANTTPTNGQCTPCTEEGAMVCMGDSQFGICNRGCAVPQAMAAGMSCTDGVAVASTKKRHIHFPRAHLHRSLSAAHLI